jgi:uncharacterized membrane protein YhhN
LIVVVEAQTATLCAICLVAATGYIVASWYEKSVLAGASKAVASIAFIVFAIVNEASETVYGRYILLALTLSLIGDLCLLSRKSHFLLAGIAAFFFAHFAFIAAFAQLDLDKTYFLFALICTSVAAGFILKWLWKYLAAPYKVAVSAYLIVMILMSSLAIAANSIPILGIAAILFAVSDVSVARDRFVARDIVNKAWGLPLYYIAQLLFAASVITVV